MEHWADLQLCTQGTVQCDTVGVSSPQLSIHSTVQCDTVGVSSPQLSIHSTVQCDAVGVSSPQLCIRNRGHSSVTRWVWARHSSARTHSAVRCDVVGMSLCSQHRIHTQQTLQKYTVVCNSQVKNSTKLQLSTWSPQVSRFSFACF